MKALHLPLSSSQFGFRRALEQRKIQLPWIIRSVVTLTSTSQFAVLDQDGRLTQHCVDHQPGAIQAFLESLPGGTPVALESVGNWYWIVDEIEAAGCLPLLANPAKAKVMIPRPTTSPKLKAAG